MAFATSINTWTGSVSDGDDLIEIIGTDLEINDFKIYGFTLQSDSELTMLMSPPKDKPNRAKTFEINSSYLLSVSNANEGIGIQGITKMVVEGSGSIVINFYH